MLIYAGVEVEHDKPNVYMYIYIYICMFVCMYVCMLLYVAFIVPVQKDWGFQCCQFQGISVSRNAYEGFLHVQKMQSILVDAGCLTIDLS